MSFKREGDDHSLLQQIRKRRIEELFAYDIPEKEALLLRDGRFTCTICPHRPLFDTIAVLAVHRQGKKHKANNVKQEDIHPMVSNSGTSAAQQTSQPQRIKNESSCGNALMSAASYNPCVKRNQEDKDTRIELDRNISSTSILKRLANFQQHDSIPTDFRPYKSKRRTNATPVETLYSSQQAVKDNEPPAKSRNLQQLSEARPVSLDKTTNNVEVFYESEYPCNQVAYPRDPDYCTSTKEIQADTDNVQHQHTWRTKLIPVSSKNVTEVKKVEKTKVKKITSTSLNTPKKSGEPTEKQILAERYLQAVQSGWKRDRSGKWVKDDTVEFESDEEPPDIP